MSQKKYDCLKLENQLCFPLYACSREIIKRYKPFLDEIGLTYTQYVTMMVIWEKEQISTKELGTLLHLDSGTLTPVVKSLEGKGLISKERSGEDARHLIVTVTEKGTALKDDAVKIPEQMGACLNIDPRDAQQLYELLYKVMGQWE